MPIVFEQSLVLQDFLTLKLGGNPLDPRDRLHTIRKVTPATSASGPSPYFQAFLPFRVSRMGESCSVEDLASYDRDIALVTDQMNAARPLEPVRWLYFQWAALMSCAIYLDLYYGSRESLLDQLNQHLDRFNRERGLRLPAYTIEDLGRLSLWMATGAGKTLLLHANVLQHRLYVDRHMAQRPRHTLVVVPNESLARQHVAELGRSGLRARLYHKATADLYARSDILVLVITNMLEPRTSEGASRKAGDGETLYEPERFGSHNLVLVDEGHRGKDDEGRWRNIRRFLCAEGFVIEYSATLKEVVHTSLASLAQRVEAGAKGMSMAREYARSIAVDYSFKRFHHDGYGKHFRVLALAANHEHLELALDGYLTGCLLAFYEQIMVYEESRALSAEHRIERPLAVFAGLRVRGEDSDVVDAIALIGRFLTRREHFVPLLRNLLDEVLVIRTRRGTDVFSGMFSEVRRVHGVNASSLYDDMVRRLFLVEGATRLRAARRKDAEGEIELRVGDAEPFGVVNVGNPSEVLRELERPAHQSWVQVCPEITGGSLFEDLGNETCRATMLIGSRKFMEGWNSFRVSMLGIFNIGQNAGTQIIQLFGRGVRLRGKDGSLKRFSRDKGRERAGSTLERLRVLETISLFTVNAKYLQLFEKEIQERLEGEPDGEPVTVEIPIVGDRHPPRLRVLKLPRAEEFRRARVVEVGPNAGLAADGTRPFIDIYLDYYPRAGSRASVGAAGRDALTSENIITTLDPWLVVLDHDALYLRCAQMKNEEGWHNLKLPRFVGADSEREPVTQWILRRSGWFRVAIEQRFVSPEHVADLSLLPTWQRLAGELVCAYISAHYKWYLRAWQTSGAKVVWWDELNPSEQQALVPEGQFSETGARHKVTINVQEHDGGSSESVVQFVRDIASEVARGVYEVGRRMGLRSMGMEHSLYRPLLSLEDSPPVTIQCRPVALNRGEEDLLDAIDRYLRGEPSVLAGAQVHILRNESRRGLGFFVGAGFYPDFIFWIVKGGKQWVIFVDPKGATHMATRLAAAKLTLPRLLWEIERRNALPDVHLDAFVVFGTREADLDETWMQAHGELTTRMLFTSQGDYVDRLFTRALARG